jgi:hypothetical protein
MKGHYDMRHTPHLAIAGLILTSFLSPPALAAGSTYQSSAESDPKKAPLEECRFKKLDRSPEANVCVYSRQSGGPEVRITIDQRVNCVQTFKCKIVK